MVEVQSQEKSDFAKRMYQYNYRSFDLYERPVISLAVLGDERASWRPSEYGYALGGCRISLEFPIIKLLDYNAHWQDLEESSNPFAVMVMAHLKTKATRGNPQQRERWKWNLVRGLYDRGYDREDIMKLFRLLDWMMSLPEQLQRRFEVKLTSYQEERQMPVLSRMEHRGMQAGILQTARESVLEVLDVRFEVVPTEVIEAVKQIEDPSVLKQLLRQAISITSIEEFQQVLEQSTTTEDNLTGES